MGEEINSNYRRKWWRRVGDGWVELNSVVKRSDWRLRNQGRITDAAERRFFCRAVTSNSRQRLLHRMRNSNRFIARLHVRWASRLRQETQYLASALTDELVQCICRNINCAQELVLERKFHLDIPGYPDMALKLARLDFTITKTAVRAL